MTKVALELVTCVLPFYFNIPLAFEMEYDPLTILK